MLGIVVISPHLDDAVLSIGATLHRLARSGHRVKVVTIFAGDPTREGPPSYWDAVRGVATASEALEHRRSEDLRAADLIGFEPVWLPFEDSGYVFRRDPDAIMGQLRPHLDDADLVLVPGWPLKHADHRYVSMLMLQEVRDRAMVLYSELPYAAEPRNLAVAVVKGRSSGPAGQAVSDEIDWRAVRTPSEDRAAKRSAIACYSGEVAALGYRARVLDLYGRLGRPESFGYSDDLLNRGGTSPMEAEQVLIGTTPGARSKGSDGSGRTDESSRRGRTGVG